jgi:effector-binding domain-containing protein
MSVVDVKPIAICVVRVTTQIAAWPQQFGRSLDKIWAAAQAGQIQKPGKNVMVYRHRPDGLVDIECGAEAPEGFLPAGEIVASATPSGRAVTIAHVGDYRRLRESHDALTAWARQNGHALQPVCWEIYDHWRDNPETVRTDLFHLLA